MIEKSVEFNVLDGQPLAVSENVGHCCIIEHLVRQYSFPGQKYILETGLLKQNELIIFHVSQLYSRPLLINYKCFFV